MTVAISSPLHPHPLANAGTLNCKLAKASLRGEGQGEGRLAQFKAVPLASRCLRGDGDE
jgi:hypothetical protein